MPWTTIDGARSARGVDQSALRRLGGRVLEFLPLHLRRQSGAQVLPPLRTSRDWNKRAGSNRGEECFEPHERGPARSSGRYWRARFRGWPLSCGRLSRRIFSFGWRRLDSFKLAVLDLLHAPSQAFAQGRPMPIDLPQTGVAAVLGDGGQAINPLDIVESLGECFGRD